MTHKAIQIRDAMQTALIGQTDALSNVFVSRVRSVLDDEMPAVSLVIEGDEVIERASESFQPTETIRQLEIGVLIGVKVEDGYEDSAYTIAGQIEDALLVDRYLGLGNRLINNVIYTGCKLETGNDGETNTAILKMMYSIDFSTIEGCLL